MKQLQIEIVAVPAPTFVKTAKGGYNILEVAYKHEGKVSGKKVLDFVSQEVFNTLSNAKAGEFYTVETEKNEKGYFDWKAVVSGVESIAETITVGSPAGTGGVSSSNILTPKPSYAGKGRVVGSTYETEKERAKRQVVISRLAVLNSAIEYARGGPDAAGVEEIFAVAEKMEAFVFAGLAVKAKNYIDILPKAE